MPYGDEEDEFDTGLNFSVQGLDDLDRKTGGFGKCEETSPTSVGTRRGDKSRPLPNIPAREVQGSANTPRVFNTSEINNGSQSESRNYGSRTKAGDVVLRYNCEDSSCWEGWKASGVKWPIKINPAGTSPLSSATKYMFQRTREIANVLNEAVTELGSTITEYYSLGPPANLKESTAEDEVFVGRIRRDGGKLSGGSVLFEGTMESSSGHIVQLDMSQMEEYFIFPGQVLGLSGMNNLGRCVRVSNLFIPRPFPLHEGKISINTATGPLNVLIAAGPFTPKDSLQFEPLADLIQVIVKTEPDVCFLIGPFLEDSHPFLSPKEAPLPETFLEMFEKRLRDLVGMLETYQLHTKLILVSSWKDVHHDAVYPTVPYITKNFPTILSLSDPGTISIGGIIFSVTSTDILMHLSRNELAHATISSDRMGRLARHLLSQRNFYPLYPPDESIPLDVELWSQHAQLQVTPHVLILPSDLRHFIKDVDGTLVINPERLTKGQSGGTFVRLMIDLPNEPDDDSGVGDGSPISDFVAGEIVRI